MDWKLALVLLGGMALFLCALGLSLVFSNRDRMECVKANVHRPVAEVEKLCGIQR